MCPSLFVLSNERDFSCDEVVRRIDTDTIYVERINIESALSSPVRPWSTTVPPYADAVWWRQFYLEHPVTDVTAIDDLLVQRSQWSAWLEALNHPQSSWVNPLWPARRAENKLLQLKTAADVGFNIPNTVVTNDPSEAEQFGHRYGSAVVKALTAPYFEFSSQSFAFTAPLDEALRFDSDQWYAQPVIVQSRITEGFDVRVIAFGGREFVARAPRERLDWRTGQQVGWHVCSIPTWVSHACRKYLDRMGLRFGAFDLIHDGATWWFLECNQAGEWGWLDRELSLGVAAKLSEYLKALARAQL